MELLNVIQFSNVDKHKKARMAMHVGTREKSSRQIFYAVATSIE